MADELFFRAFTIMAALSLKATIAKDANEHFDTAMSHNEACRSPLLHRTAADSDNRTA